MMLLVDGGGDDVDVAAGDADVAGDNYDKR